MQNQTRFSAWCVGIWALGFAGTLWAQGGPSDRPKLDDAAVERGRAVYAAQCINCHGSAAKGSPNGPDLMRSTAVLKDRVGSHLGPALRAAAISNPATATAHGAATPAQIIDLAHFLRDRVEAIARNRGPTEPINVLTGNAEAGRAYFNGVGRCSTCHLPEGDFAGLASRTFDAATLQQRFLFPDLNRSKKRVEVTVTPPTGQQVSGVLVRIDSFSVSLRDAAGDYHAFSRGPGVRVEVHDPLAAHHELLDHYTDENIHDVVAYLWTLK